MVARRRGGHDRLAVVVDLCPAGEAVRRTLARHAITEPKTEGPALVSSLKRLVKKSVRQARRRTAARPRSR